MIESNIAIVWSVLRPHFIARGHRVDGYVLDSTITICLVMHIVRSEGRYGSPTFGGKTSICSSVRCMVSAPAALLMALRRCCLEALLGSAQSTILSAKYHLQSLPPSRAPRDRIELSMPAAKATSVLHCSRFSLRAFTPSSVHIHCYVASITLSPRRQGVHP